MDCPVHIAINADPSGACGVTVRNGDCHTDIGRMPDLTSAATHLRRLTLCGLGGEGLGAALCHVRMTTSFLSGLHTLECYNTPVEPEELPPNLHTLVFGPVAISLSLSLSKLHRSDTDASTPELGNLVLANGSPTPPT